MKDPFLKHGIKELNSSQVCNEKMICYDVNVSSEIKAIFA